MSGPKCDAIELEELEWQRMQEEYEERLRQEQERILREQERIRKEQERKRQEEEQRREEERRRQEEEKRREEERLLQEKRQRARDFDASVEAGYQELLRFKEERKQREILNEQEKDILKLRFDEAKARYEAAVKLAGETPDNFVYGDEISEEIILKLQAEADRISEQTVARACQAAVSDMIDEVITGMGYDILAERTDRTDKQITSRLYRYDTDTAISVIGVGGQFTMEVVAVDDKDRKATPEETRRLYECMEHFCEDYEKIKWQLEQTGKIEAKSIYHLPPDKRYARVVNQSVYKSNDSNSDSAAKKQKKRKRRYGENYMDQPAYMEGEDIWTNKS